MSTPNVFDRAREVLRERGWKRGSNAEDGHPGVCVLGALNIAEGLSNEDGQWRPASRPLLEQVIAEQYPGWADREALDIPDSVAWAWNDRVPKTVAEVDALLDKCGRIVDERVSP
jgi:hypothetical protein